MYFPSHPLSVRHCPSPTMTDKIPQLRLSTYSLDPDAPFPIEYSSPKLQQDDYYCNYDINDISAEPPPSLPTEWNDKYQDTPVVEDTE